MHHENALFFIVNRLFSDISVSQDSVIVGFFNNSFTANLLQNLSVKIFWKSIEI